MRGLLRAIGYDPEIVDGLAKGDVRFFAVATIASFVAALVVGVGTGYGGWLTLGPVVGVPLGVAGFLFLVNLLRLHHAGSGYPLHLPVEDIVRWRPAGTASMVLFALGLLLAQPVAFLVLKPSLDERVAAHVAEQRAVRAQLGLADATTTGGVAERGPADGLILRATVAWRDERVPTAALVGFFALLVALPALLRRFGAWAVRDYESERWIRERMFVDDEFAQAQDAITAMLREVPGFSGTLALHYADPPYNTKPLVFGLDPSIFVEGGIRFVRPKHVDGDPLYEAPPPSPVALAPAPARAPSPPPTAPPPRPAVAPAPAPAPLPASATAPGPAPVRAPPAPATPIARPAPPAGDPKPAPATTTPIAKPAPPPVARAPAAPRAADAQGEELAPSPAWDDPTHDADVGPPAPAFFDVGRAQAKRALAHVDETAPLIARYTGRSEAEVRDVLARAAPDERLHRLFPEWKRLPTILLNDAGFALDFGLAPVLAIITERPVADVERRLRAAPRDKRLSGVFAPELARRLLKKQGGARR